MLSTIRASSCLRAAALLATSVFLLLPAAAQEDEGVDAFVLPAFNGVAVAQAHGIALAATLPADMVKIANTFPPQYKPSLLVDLEHGRRLEIEAWNGALVRYGKAAGVPTPVNEVIYACLKPYANGALT